MTVRVDRVEDECGFRALEADWTALLGAIRDRNLFLSWDWVSLWWTIYGRGNRLYVLVARDASGQLLGIAPLKRRPLVLLGVGLGDVVEFIGTGGDVTPERLDFLIRPGAEAPVAAAMVAALYDDRSIVGLDLKPMAASSPARPFVLTALAGHAGQAATETPHSVCPVLTLPSTWEAFLSGRSKNYRKKIGEYQRRGVRDFGATIRLTTSPDELGRDMSLLIDLHARRWDGSSRAFRTPAYVEFHRRFAERLLAADRLRLFVLDSPDGPLAALYCFAQDGRYYFYQSGRDPERSRHRPGLVLMHAAIQHAIEEGVGVFDFLSGGEAYKYIWAGEEQASVHLEHWRTPSARFVARARPWLRRVRHPFTLESAPSAPSDSGGAL
jgi:CelD/BcsL family acetyltransferase involved in cellulose biosynthesis